MSPVRSSTRPYVIAWVSSRVFYFLAYAIRSSPAVMIPELARAFGVLAGGVGTILRSPPAAIRDRTGKPGR